MGKIAATYGVTPIIGTMMHQMKRSAPQPYPLSSVLYLTYIRCAILLDM